MGVLMRTEREGREGMEFEGGCSGGLIRLGAGKSQSFQSSAPEKEHSIAPFALDFRVGG
jgi:hypothetical protein